MLLACAGVALACSGTYQRLKGEEIRPGVFKVMRTPGLFELPNTPDQWDSIGISRMSDFWAYYQNLMADNDLVFFARIDSVIESGLGAIPPWDTVVPGLVPDIVLENRFPPGVAFYAHIVVDSLLKGSLPSKNFWIKGFSSYTTCGMDPWITKTSVSFLNFSDKLDSIQDLKFNANTYFCVNCPPAHLFDGRYLQSPRFPVLKLDITQPYVELRDTLIETGLRGSAARRGIPWRRDFKSYMPDGRTVNPATAPKTPVPLVR